MTQDEIIEMARQAGIPSANVSSLAFGRAESGVELLEAFAKLVEDAAFARWALQTKLAVQDEREACAKVCEDFDSEISDCCANAIRARGEA
jgi:hypothetical protein